VRTGGKWTGGRHGRKIASGNLYTQPIHKPTDPIKLGKGGKPTGNRSNWSWEKIHDVSGRKSLGNTVGGEARSNRLLGQPEGEKGNAVTPKKKGWKVLMRPCRHTNLANDSCS